MYSTFTEYEVTNIYDDQDNQGYISDYGDYIKGQLIME